MIYTILVNIIEQLLNNDIFKNRVLINNQGLINTNYIYTCLSNSEFNNVVSTVRQECINNGSNLSPLLVKSKVTEYLFNQCKPYFTMVKNSINILDEHIFIEQKTQEWLQFRKNIITGTETEKIILKHETEDKNNIKLYDIAKSKVDIKSIFNLPNYISKGFSSAALSHGNTYEDVSLAIYCSRYQVEVREYGIIKSRRNVMIGASPDGVVVNVNYDNYESFKRLGRLVEVKNPYSRVIDDTISDKYQLQMYQQQYSCVIPVCDFLETTIVDADCYSFSVPPYNNLNEMLKDVLDTSKPDWQDLIENKNIPYQNLSSSGKEKGYLIRFYRFRNNNSNDEEFKTVWYPLDAPYNRESILEWKTKTIEEMGEQGYRVKTYKYWRLDVLDVKEFIYDADKYQNKIIPELEKNWAIINNYKSELIDLLLREKNNFDLSNNDNNSNVNNYLVNLTYEKFNEKRIMNNVENHNSNYLNTNNPDTQETSKPKVDIDINKYF